MPRRSCIGCGRGILLAERRPPGYADAMIEPDTIVAIDDAEARALAVAIAQSDADPRTVPHAEVRAWLLRLANGETNLTAPVPG